MDTRKTFLGAENSSLTEMPSVTSIIGSVTNPSLEAWRERVGHEESEEIRESAALLGDTVHKSIENLVNGRSVEVPNNAEPAIKAFLKWYNKFNPEIIYSELSIYYPELFYAGTINMVAKIDGELYLIDFKTSKYFSETHDWRMAAYASRYESLKGKLPKLMIVRLNKYASPSFPKYEIRKVDYATSWEEFVFAYREILGIENERESSMLKKPRMDKERNYGSAWTDFLCGAGKFIARVFGWILIAFLIAMFSRRNRF